MGFKYPPLSVEQQQKSQVTMYSNLSNMIRENVESGKYEHADDDNGGETKQKKRISCPTKFFINESKEENTRRRNKKQRKRRRQTKRTTKTDEVDEDDEDDVHLSTGREAHSRNQVLYDTSSDESGNESLLNKKRVMKSRRDNLQTRQMIDDDIDEEMERRNKSDNYVSLEDGGDVFNLEKEMIRMEEKSDEDDNIKATRKYLEKNYELNINKRDAEIRDNLKRDMQLVKRDPLFDQELSDDDDDEKKERGAGHGDIHINGSNNNVSINIVRSAPGYNGNNRGYPWYQPQVPMVYPSMPYYHPQPPQPPQQQQPSYWDQFENRPRFLGALPHHHHHQIQDREVNNPSHWVGNASISNRILERVQPFIQYSTTDDRDWIERVIMIAKDLDNGKSTISHRDWIYNQRRKFKDGYKGEILRLFNFSNHY